MMHHVKRLARKKSVWGFGAVLAVTGTVMGVQATKAPQPLRYVLAPVTRGTLVTSISGSGQVSGLNQIDLKPTVSGALTNLLVKPGDTVTAGTAIAEIDPKVAQKSVRDAAQAVRDAQLSLASSQLSLEKMKQPASGVSLLQSQNNLNQAKRDLEKLQAGSDPADIQQAKDELASVQENAKMSDDGSMPLVVRNAYDDAVSLLKTTGQTLQQSLTDADTILGVDNPNAVATPYANLLSVLDTSKLVVAKQKYTQLKISVTTFRQTADALKISGEVPASIDASLASAQTVLNLMEPFLGSTMQDVLANTLTSASFSQNSLTSLVTMMQTDRSNIASKFSSITNQEQAIDQAHQTYASSQLSIEKSLNVLNKLIQGATAYDLAAAKERVAEAQASLDALQKPPDAIDLAVSQNSVARSQSSLQSAQNRLSDAEETLADYTVRAPFDGIVARVPVHVADQMSPSTAIATLLTQAKVAQLTLNEVDVSKVKVGQKATLTFDALPDLTIAGVVSEVDSIGTVSQGVVSYAVKITFETQDDRIKTGMNVSASIITDAHTDVLMVPSSAIRSNGNGNTVQMLAAPVTDPSATNQGVTSSVAPTSHDVQTGLSNDQDIEITSGLNEGDQVIVRTVDPNVKNAATATGANSALQGLGGVGGGSATFRRAGG